MTANARLLKHAKSMRSALTAAEAVIWHHIRGGRFSGVKFKRQQPIGNYIADFVCFAQRLAIEVDGGQHNGSANDTARDAWFVRQGFRVLRFWNNDVSENLEGVLMRIREALAPSPSVPLPRGEREGIAGQEARAALPPRRAGQYTDKAGSPAAPLPSRERGWGEGE